MNPRPLRCAISDRDAGAGNGWPNLVEQAGRLAADGVDLLQVREKNLAAGELTALVHLLLATLRGSQTRLLVNGRADVALATGADGVHLTSNAEELTPLQIHCLYAESGLPAPLVTLSCHSIKEVERHRLDPLSAILFGPVFEKSVGGVRHAEGTGLALLREVCLVAAPIPVLALGGITPADIAACMEAGASGVAGIRLFQGI